MEENTLITFPHLEAALEEYGEAVRNLYQDKLIRGNKIATGDLLNSVEFEVKHEGTIYEVGLNLASYWKYVEYGRKPGGKFPPVNAIRDWIKVKPVLPKPMANGKLPTLNQLSFLIGRSIAENGIKPTNALEKAKEETNDKYIEKIVEAFSEDIGTNALNILAILSD